MNKGSLIAACLVLIVLACKKPFQPKLKASVSNLLVIEGVINGTPGGITTIALSRLRQLNDTSYNNPEFGATIAIEEEGGSVNTLQPRDSGFYSSTPLTLDASKRYRLNIATGDGRKYNSDFVSILSTPEIDSVTWEQRGDLNLYVYTHDPKNATHYYRWDYVETWEYHTYYNSLIKFENDTVVFDFVHSNFICWKSENSRDISIGTSIALSSDVISHQLIGTVPKDSQKGSERYSPLVRQYALTNDAYRYWQTLQKTTQELGSLFDVQPSQLKGNIHDLADEAQPVVGFVSASTVTAKRIFVDHASLTDWMEFAGNSCQELGVIPNIPAVDHQYFADGLFAPYHFIGMNGIVYTRPECVDCRLQGGTTDKPSYW
ncbi:MAG TPA: DUF4249 domain-containing protein [Chitinophagaceae bacterium]|jgi:hypothetical protein